MRISLKTSFPNAKWSLLKKMSHCRTKHPNDSQLMLRKRTGTYLAVTGTTNGIL
jgi:hypothetical protein